MAGSARKRIVAYLVVGGVGVVAALVWRFHYANPAGAYAGLEAYCDRIGIPLPSGAEVAPEHVPEIQRLCEELCARQGLELEVPERALCIVRRYASPKGGAMVVEFLPPRDVTAITGVRQGALRILPDGSLVDVAEWREAVGVGRPSGKDESPALLPGGASRPPTARSAPATQPQAR